MTASTGKPSNHPAAPSGPGKNHHIVVENVTPSVDGGLYAAKRVAGDPCVVEADIFRDGHDLLNAVVKWRPKDEKRFKESPLSLVENDRWRGEFPLERNVSYLFTIEAWTDRFGTWLADFTKRVDAGMPALGELSEGIALIQNVVSREAGDDQSRLTSALGALNASGKNLKAALAAASHMTVVEIMTRLQTREGACALPREFEVVADVPIAEAGAWYELFIRSQTNDLARGGTFRDAEKRLADVAAMGFDVVYLPPIHPIGITARKGRNNALTTQPGDPGCPWAIGNEHGGHTAIEPALGTLEDFDHFVAAAKKLDLHIALDFAVQCSPDHPWVKKHPEWFYRRPDGSIKYAENPPKKYEDIYPLNFDSPAYMALWTELERTVSFWIDHGVKIFRVDNPHTKPIRFWQWLIAEVRAKHPDVVFLAEAFTRPKMMKALAKIGFTQSYTYFTWRNAKAELTEYLTELSSTEMKDYFRPNFFANTPDILHEFLQTGGRAAFKLRLVLAATLSPSYGIYSGFELCENQAVPGTEEYMNSEKYEIRVRDWNAPGNLRDFIRTINAARRDNPALERLANIHFIPTTNDSLIAYVKKEAGNVVIIVVNLDPFQPQAGNVQVPLDLAGARPGGTYEVRDLITGNVFVWGETNYVRLDPGVEPAHVLKVEKRF